MSHGTDLAIALALTGAVAVVLVFLMLSYPARLALVRLPSRVASRARGLRVSWPSVWVGMAVGYVLALVRIMWWAR